MKKIIKKFGLRLAGAWQCLTALDFELWSWRRKSEIEIDLNGGGGPYLANVPLSDAEFLNLVLLDAKSQFLRDVTVVDNLYILSPMSYYFGYEHRRILDRYNRYWTYNIDTNEIEIPRNK